MRSELLIPLSHKETGYSAPLLCKPSVPNERMTRRVDPSHALAFYMATHPRLGSGSFLRGLKDELFRMILPPAVETPIRTTLLLGEEWVLHPVPHVSSSISFTVIDNGVTVFRGLIVKNPKSNLQSAYVSRMFPDGQVKFIFILGFDKEFEVDVHEILCQGLHGMRVLQTTRCETVKDIEDVRAKNGLGIELRLSDDLSGPFTPLLKE